MKPVAYLYERLNGAAFLSFNNMDIDLQPIFKKIPLYTKEQFVSENEQNKGNVNYENQF